MKILLGITGSVATSLTPKLAYKLQANGHEVKIVATDMAFQFLDKHSEDQSWAVCKSTTQVLTDKEEFYIGRADYFHYSPYKKDDPILHIELRDWADIMLVAPTSVNTMAKMVNGICDNLLTSVFRAWDFSKPLYVAPSCNTKMWTHPVTKTHLKTLKEWGVNIIYPTVKKLACGEYGIGALADLDTIVNLTEGYRWENPFKVNNSSALNTRAYPFDFYLPLSPHPGAFGTPRHQHCHTGVDQYSPLGTEVNPVEDGEIVSLGQFTGEAVGCGYWLDTFYATVKGKSGNVCYGEILLKSNLVVGMKVTTKDVLGTVLRVVKELPKKHVEGHKPNMLHLELLKNEFTSPDWKIGEEKPKDLLDPTQYLYFLKL